MNGSNGAGVTANGAPADKYALDLQTFDTFPRDVKEMIWNYCVPLCSFAVQRRLMAGGSKAALDRGALQGMRDAQILAKWPKPGEHPLLRQPLKADWM